MSKRFPQKQRIKMTLFRSFKTLEFDAAICASFLGCGRSKVQIQILKLQSIYQVLTQTLAKYSRNT